jgi:hypothetical protein
MRPPSNNLAVIYTNTDEVQIFFIETSEIEVVTVSEGNETSSIAVSAAIF